MLRKSLGVVATVLVLAGCSTTVPGSPQADPSGVPRPDTGSYATAPRSIGPMTEKTRAAAEGFRMMAIMPLAPDIDPAIRYGQSPHVGQMDSILKLLYGDSVATALAGHEVGATTSATSKVPGSDSTAPSVELLTGLFRFKDEAGARAAVANPKLLAPDAPLYGEASALKTPVAVPGYADAKAYTKTTGTTKVTVGLVASGRFVIAVWTSGSADLIKKYADQQIPALKDFVPTPVDKFSTLTRDHDDLLRYTLAEQSPTVFEATLPARVIAAFSTDVTAAVKEFADGGVDYVANAGNTVYRAKDEAGAKLLADRALTDTKSLRKDATEGTVRGVPGGRCLKYAQYTGAKDFRTYCVVPVGRYLAEVTDVQEARAQQALGASYLILQQAK